MFNIHQSKIWCGLLCIVLLCGCHSQVRHTAQLEVERAADAVESFSRNPDAHTVLRVETDRPWTGFTRLASRQTPLPVHLQADDAVTLSLSGQLSDSILARRIESAAGMAVRFVGGDVSGVTALDHATDVWVPEHGIWTGSLNSLLDLWCDAGGYAWRIVPDSDVIEIIRERTVAFRLNALAGVQSVNGTASTTETGGDDGGTSLARQTMSTRFARDPWPEIIAQLESQLEEDTRVSAAPATATVIVRGTPANIEQARKYFSWLNRTVLLPVTLTVEVYAVEFQESSNFEAGINGVLGSIIGTNTGVEFNGSSIGIIKPSPGGDSLATAVSILRRKAAVSRILSATVPSLNAQPAQFFELFSEAYLREIRTTTNDGGAQTSLVPGTVASGFALTYIAQSVAADEVLLRLFASIQDRPVFATFRSANQQIQLPAYGSRTIQVTQKVARGETLVLTGFRDRGARSSDSGSFDADVPFPFGNAAHDVARVEQVLLVKVATGTPLGIAESPGSDL